ncbi:hypothetical protein C6P97_14360 [Burkholderia multivorans]|uniref:Uncharacterized protein n=1 Tax=Burkholderia multivorans TaxID=87883 RepID=A0AB37APU8_9BURK|nr:hypothetical protein C6P99_18525 [Burkholderia multivorans]PRE48707.1 hypothetical protein C6P97_14360 [Burkholderia multivorans]
MLALAALVSSLGGCCLPPYCGGWGEPGSGIGGRGGQGGPGGRGGGGSQGAIVVPHLSALS